MNDQKPPTCPYCGSPVKYPGRPLGRYPGDTYIKPTTFSCGTVTSPHWGPPVRDKNCGKRTL